MAELMSHSVIKPPALRSGGRVAIFSPASYKEGEKFDRAVQRFNSLGYEVVEGRWSRARYHYFAGNDEARSEDVNRFIADDSISAMIASRGGYGCSRILPLVDVSKVVNSPKIILGGSDFTAILWQIHQLTGLITFFGPMALQIGAGLNRFTQGELWKALKGGLSGELHFPAEYEPISVIPGRARGRLIGGCLSLVVSLLGTKYFGDVTGRLLFLEEVGERPYRIDRMLTHLRNAGVFRKISGLILGDFHRCWAEDDGESMPLFEIVRQLIPDEHIPVLAGLPFGHSKYKMTIPLGVEAEIDSVGGSFTFLEEGVIIDV